MATARTIVLIIVGLGLLACTKHEPEKIYWAKDTCSHCKMLMTDSRFGGEILTKKGKVFKFDSLECLTAFQHSHQSELTGDDQVYLVDSFSQGSLVRLEEAWVIEDQNLRSPMGKGFLASAQKKLIDAKPAKEGSRFVRPGKDVLLQLKNRD